MKNNKGEINRRNYITLNNQYNKYQSNTYKQILWKQNRGDNRSKNYKIYQLQEKKTSEGMCRWVLGQC